MTSTIILESRKREITLAIFEEQRNGKYGELVKEKTELNIALDRVQSQIREVEKCIQRLPLTVQMVKFYYHSYREILATIPAKHRPKSDLPPESEIECQINWVDREIDEDDFLSEAYITQLEEEPIDENRVRILTDSNSEEELNEMLINSRQENQEFQETIICPLKSDLAKLKGVLKGLLVKERVFQEERERILKIGRSYKEAIDSLSIPKKNLDVPRSQSLISRAISLISSLKTSLVLLFFILATDSVFSLSSSPPRSFYITSGLNITQNPQIAVNDQGAAVLAWIEENGSVLKYSLKNSEGIWSVPELIKEWEWLDEIETLRCSIDLIGNVTFSWQNDNDDLIIVKKNIDSSYVVLKDDSDTFEFAPNFRSEHSSEFSQILAKNLENSQFMLWWQGGEDGDYFYLSQQNQDGSWLVTDKVSVPFWYYSAEKTHMKVDSNKNVYITIETVDNNGFFSLYRTDNQWSEFEFVDKNDDFIFESSFESPSQQSFDTAIDPKGNLMAIWEMSHGSKSVIYGTYKPFGRPWSQPVALTPRSERNFKPFLKADEDGHFVLVWNRNSNWNNYTIQGMTFSASTFEWSTPDQLSPAGGKYSVTSFDLSPNGHGAIAAISYEDPFDLSVKAFMISTH